jgi:signal peptidase II
MGQGKSWLFATLSVLAIAGILYWLFVAKAARDLLLTLTLAGISAGILGNLYDRLGLWGGETPDGQTIYAVRDWILFRYGKHTWPNFNIADSLLVCGACVLILHAWKSGGDPPRGGIPAAELPKN